MMQRNLESIEIERVSQSVPSTDMSAAIGLPRCVTITGCRRTLRAYRRRASGASLSSRVFKLHHLSADSQLIPFLYAYRKYFDGRLGFIRIS